MAFLTICLHPSEKEKIQQLLSSKSLHIQQIKRLEVLKLLDKGIETNSIAQQLGVRVERVRKYIRIYKNGGIDGVITMEKPGKESVLSEDMFKKLEEYIANNRINKKFGRAEMTQFIKENYDIEITPEWLARRLLQRKMAVREQPWD